MDLEGTLVSVKEILGYLAQDRYLNLTEASGYLGFSKRGIRDRLDEIPHRRLGTRLLLFKKSELDTWLEQYREGGKDELDELVNETLAKVI
jgi:excisionase family DNA binding protein